MTAQDGLTLHVRRYGSRHTSAHSVMCLPGLARTAADFHLLATALAADPANPRLVLALDYRGHGQSDYDRNAKNYAIRVALADLSAVLAAFEITSTIFVGTSFGGVLAMMLAVLPPAAVAGVILNDIGPVMEPRVLDADQKLCGKAPDRTQLRRGRGNPALVIRGAVHAARTAGLGCVCPANLARGPRYPRAVP